MRIPRQLRFDHEVAFRSLHGDPSRGVASPAQHRATAIDPAAPFAFLQWLTLISRNRAACVQFALQVPVPDRLWIAIDAMPAVIGDVVREDDVRCRVRLGHAKAEE